MCSYSTSRTETITIVFFNLHYTLPVLPVTLSCIISAYTLLRTKNSMIQQSNSEQMSLVRDKIRSTITIVWFTVVYIVFNIPVCVVWILISVERSNYFNFFLFDRPGHYFVNFIPTLSVALNSVINPILDFWRMRYLRENVRSMLRDVVRLFQPRRNAYPDIELNAL